MTDFENKIESLVNLIKDDYSKTVIDKLVFFSSQQGGNNKDT